MTKPASTRVCVCAPVLLGQDRKTKYTYFFKWEKGATSYRNLLRVKTHKTINVNTPI